MMAGSHLLFLNIFLYPWLAASMQEAHLITSEPLWCINVIHSVAISHLLGS